MPFPSTLSTFNRPTASDRLNSPSHSALHNSVSSAVGQIEEVIGLSTSSAVGTLFYDIRSPDSNGGGHVQTANKGGTGQTSYTKGDILVATSSSVLTKLAVGTDGAAIVADSNQAAGVKWGNATGNIQSFVGTIASITTGVWTKPSAAGLYSRVLVELWGAGGSGAGAVAGATAAGGGGGAYVSGWYNASILSASVLVGVGGGGSGANASGNDAGNAGGNTVFDTQSSLLTAYGGGGGGVNAAGASGGGGGGGVRAAGSNGAGANQGGGGSFLGGLGGQPGSVGGIGSYFGAIAGAGGGGGSGGPGANATFAGAGGGGVTSSAVGAAGTSAGAGSGTAGSILLGVSILAGRFPGGGGGAAHGAGSTSGPGGNGLAIITTFF